MKSKNSRKAGFVVSGELILVATIMVLGLLVGMVAIRDAVIGELHDTAEAYGALNQSYEFAGTEDLDVHTETEGAAYDDEVDDGDTIGYSVAEAVEAEAPQP